MKTIGSTILPCILFALCGAKAFAAPVAYSGKVAINGLNLDGMAQFRFNIRDANGTILWRSKEDANGNTTPIDVPVDRGHYLVLLGGQGMDPLPANLFLENPDLYLQVRVKRPDTGEWLNLSPYPRITSSPHALAADVANLAKLADYAKAVEPGAITKNMLAADVLADLNATVVLSEQNATIQPGSVTLSHLSPGVRADLNGTISRSRLAGDVLADLNRTIVITRDMLPGDVLSDLNGTITRSRLAQDVLADLNRTIVITPGSITANLLAPGLLDQNVTIAPGSITKSMLAADVLAELNATTSFSEAGAVAFSVKKTSDQGGVTDGNWTMVTWGQAGFDTGGYFDFNASHYVIPTSGIYAFFAGAQFATVPTTAFAGLALKRNGNTIHFGAKIRAGATSNVYSTTLAVLVTAEAGDRISIIAGQSGSASPLTIAGDNKDTYFQGFRVSETSSGAIAPNSITKSMLAADVLADLNASAPAGDGNGSVSAAPAGSLIAVQAGQSAPAGYSLYQQGEPKTLVWEERAPVSVARSAYDGIEVLAAKIYFVGGSDGSDKNIAERYDPGANQWETLNPMSVARKGVATAILDGKLYAIGGQDLTSVEIYDPATGQWSAGPALPSEVNHGGAITVGGKILLIGGRNSADQNINQVLELDPGTNQWSQKAAMPTARFGMTLVLFEGKVWVIGGYGPSSYSNKVEIYDPVANSWTNGPPLTTTKLWTSAWVSNGRIYVAGGRDGDSTYLNSIEVHDPATSQWTDFGILPENKYSAGAPVLGDKVYVVAGHNGSGYSNKVYAADLNASLAGVLDLYFRDGNASAGGATVQAEVAPSSVTMDKLSPQVRADLNATITRSRLAADVRDDLNRTATVVGTGNFEAGLRAYLRPMLKGGIHVTTGVEGAPATLQTPQVDGRFLSYQWYKGGLPIADATGTQHLIAEFNATRDVGDYEIRVSNAFAVLKTKAVLQAGSAASLAVEVGGYHNLIIKSGGSLWAVGSNSNGQLGDDTGVQRNSPVKVVDANVTAVSGGQLHSLFVKSDGSLWGMGRNGNGPLGDGTTTDRHTPVKMVDVNVTAVAAGQYHSLFLKSGGSLWTVGRNTWGQLGDGTTTDRNTPVEVVSANVTSVAVSYSHNLFLKSDGSLWGMGRNGNGQLGDGTTTDRNTPVQVVSANVTAVAAGGSHSLFQKSDGSLWAMGSNSNGQLGDGTTTDRHTPVQVLDANVTAVAGGYLHGFFLKSDGSLWGMGRNDHGQLGDGTMTDRHTPVQVVDANVTDVWGGEQHSLFRKSDGSFWAMGRNASGQLGDGTTTQRISPVPSVDLIPTVEQPYVAETAADVTDP